MHARDNKFKPKQKSSDDTQREDAYLGEPDGKAMKATPPLTSDE
jgi:hypothetical protein